MSSTRRRKTSFPPLRRAWRRRRGPRPVRRGHPHQHPDGRILLARGRLAQHLLRPQEPSLVCRARRRPQTTCPQGMTMSEMALRFILSNPAVFTVIPRMRKAPQRRVERRHERRKWPPGRPSRQAQGTPLGAPAHRAAAMTAFGRRYFGPSARQRASQDVNSAAMVRTSSPYGRSAFVCAVVLRARKPNG